MRAFRLKTWTMGIAFIASYMLVLQVLVGAFAMGAATASPMLDIFGNPLCITSSSSSESDGDRSTHTALPDCCTVACSMFAPATAQDGNPANWLSNPLVIETTRVSTPADSLPPSSPLDVGPGSPRAPPATV
ncbi:hypothetical protein [Aerobium aerolatum]|uniref:DUF2946 domain-containing protein n=1 Tax=Aquamicrobium aerolatum DSM 21857 TaxID=1121003 RepID=A0A1I3JSU0_9HYPH|nr:hypothetical protein [Aquamicrobium aerolatum]SFI63236.1 hypothetical protein SAMN03080618_00982 [Aquamicrobium aerolatum DSM 21857]